MTKNVKNFVVKVMCPQCGCSSWNVYSTGMKRRDSKDDDADVFNISIDGLQCLGCPYNFIKEDHY